MKIWIYSFVLILLLFLVFGCTSITPAYMNRPTMTDNNKIEISFAVINDNHEDQTPSGSLYLWFSDFNNKPLFDKTIQVKSSDYVLWKLAPMDNNRYYYDINFSKKDFNVENGSNLFVCLTFTTDSNQVMKGKTGTTFK